MSISKIPPRIRRVVPLVLLGLALQSVWGISLHAMYARQHGMSITKSLELALSSNLLPMLIGYTIAGTLFVIIMSRGIPNEETLVGSGKIRWNRLRVMGMILFGFAFFFTSAATIYHLVAMKWQNMNWILIFFSLVFAGIFFAQWRIRLDSETLYMIETGDTSRVNDERMQQLAGKSAQTTMNFFLVFLLFIVLPYETIVSGYLPRITLIEIGVLFVTLTVATNYWNRRI